MYCQYDDFYNNRKKSKLVHDQILQIVKDPHYDKSDDVDIIFHCLFVKSN